MGDFDGFLDARQPGEPATYLAHPDRLAAHLKQTLPIDETQAAAAVEALLEDGVVRDAAGWVPQSRLALVRDSVRDVSQAREAALERVRALCDLADDSADMGTVIESDDIRAALDGEAAP